MIINGSTQKASKVHILSTKAVQCLLPSCRVATCGDRTLQGCYSGKYHVFTGIRSPLSDTKIPKIPKIPSFPAFPRIPRFPRIPYFPRHPQPRSARRVSSMSRSIERCEISEPPSIFHRRKPRQGRVLIGRGVSPCKQGMFYPLAPSGRQK